MNLKKIAKGFFLSLLILALAYLCLLLYPKILFGYKVDYKQCSIYSDQVIDDNLKNIVDDAMNSISKSDLYEKEQHFNIYICNSMWRFGLFTQGSTLAGAVTQYDFTRNIFFRPCDIKNNKIIPAKEWYFANKPEAFLDRPLSYYFAHEMTHVMQSRYTGRGSWNYPTWLTEGYADYIGKGGDFNFNENLKLLHNNAPELDPTKGLYRNYHLKVAYLLDSSRLTIKQLYLQTPNEKELEEKISKIPLTKKNHSTHESQLNHSTEFIHQLFIFHDAWVSGTGNVDSLSDDLELTGSMYLTQKGNVIIHILNEPIDTQRYFWGKYILTDTTITYRLTDEYYYPGKWDARFNVVDPDYLFGRKRKYNAEQVTLNRSTNDSLSFFLTKTEAKRLNAANSLNHPGPLGLEYLPYYEPKEMKFVSWLYQQIPVLAEL